MKEGASRNVLRGIIQHDTLNEVNIRLSDGSRAFDYTGYTNIIFKVLKADGTSYIAAEGESVIATSPIDGIVTVILAGQATTVAGLCQSVIEIYSGADKMTTARFNYEVFESLGVDEATVSEDHYPVFQTLLTDLSELEANVESAEEQRVSAEAARASTASGYVARAEQAAADAEMWARAAQDIADGDYATRAELEAVAECAAPAGFGLGKKLTDDSNRKMGDIDNISGTGWFWLNGTSSIDGKTFGNSLLEQIEVSGNYASQTLHLFDKTSESVRGYTRLYRTKQNGVWSKWEWENPPMLADVEYRTTEWYMGKPVYAKIVNYGALPNATQRHFTHGIENIDAICHFAATAKVGAETLVVNNMKGVNHCYATANVITISTSENLSSWTSCYCCLKYTKTTDT